MTAVFVIAALVWAIADPKVAAYEGLTLSVVILVVISWGYSIFHFIFDESEADAKPIYYSLTLFPVYKYAPGKGIILHY